MARIGAWIALTLLLLTFIVSPIFGQGQTNAVIVRGKVTMPDGTPPPKQTGIERVCSDIQGSAPGPLADKKGEYVWRMDMDPMRTRVCFIQATLAGYVSSRVDISGINGYLSTTTDVAPIVLHPAIPDPRTINGSDADVPAKSKTAWKAAMKAVDADNLSEAQKQLEASAEASPKFARGWHTLGIVYEAQQQVPQAREAYQRALDLDPKSYMSYVTLTRIAIKTKDWQTATKLADALIKADPKQTYPEMYLHLAAARLKLKDLAGAESAAQESVQKYQNPRAEFVLGRIAEAKGDIPTAKEHISKYIALDPTARDIEQIKAFLQVIGKPEAAGIDPELEP